MARPRLPNKLRCRRGSPEWKQRLHVRGGQYVRIPTRSDLTVDHVDDPATIEFQSGAFIRLQTPDDWLI